MANEHSHWIASAVKHHGALHRDLAVPEGETIPQEKLEAAAKGTGLTARRARLAITLKGMHHAKDDNDGDEGKSAMRQFH